MLEFRREFDRQYGWSDSAHAVARQYLEGRCWRIRRLDQLGLAGERGGWIGNLTSFDMRRLHAKLDIAPLTDSRVRVELSVNPLFQQLTEWNHAFFRIELVELQSVLQGAGPLEEAWPAFLLAHQHAAFQWTVTLTLRGQELSPEWSEYLARLESITEFPAAG